MTHAIAPAAPQSILDQDENDDAVPERNGRSLAELVGDYAGSETPDEETECLARAVYWESKGEPLAGQLSVAEVIINRARSGRFAALDLRRRPPARPILLRPRRLHSRRRRRRSRDWRRRWRSPRSRARTSPTAPRRGRCSSTPAGSIPAGA